MFRLKVRRKGVDAATIPGSFAGTGMTGVHLTSLERVVDMCIGA
jgi:hypothetical protein